MSGFGESGSGAGGCTRRTARAAAVIFAVVAPIFSVAHSQQWRSFGDDLLVSHQLSKIAISSREAEVAQIFVDPVRNVSNEESRRLREVVLELLDHKIRIAENKEDAKFWLQIIIQDHKYPITNANHEHARGTLTFAICKYPIEETERDCENFVYFYFSNVDRLSLFYRVVPLWIEEVFSLK